MPRKIESNINKLSIELESLKKNSGTLVKYLWNKDMSIPSAEDITSVALLKDKSDIKKKDIFVLINRQKHTLKNTMWFLYQIISSKIFMIIFQKLITSFRLLNVKVLVQFHWNYWILEIHFQLIFQQLRTVQH